MRPPFDIDDRIPIRIEIDLAVRLGEFIVKSGTVDKQIMAFGHRLVALEEKDDPNKKWIPRPRQNPQFANDGFAEGIC